jgi:hypothetical protein
MAAFDQLLEQAGPACQQHRSQERLRSHLLAQLVCLGEHTLTGLLATSGQQFRDWSAAYRFYGRNRVEPAALFGVVRSAVEEQLPHDQPLVVALDDSLLRKCGHKIPGTAWRPDPLGAPFQVSFVWAQRVLQLAAAMPEGTDGAARTVPIDFRLAPTAPRPRPKAPEREWGAYRQEQKRLNINRQAAERLERLAKQRQNEGLTRPLWVTVDGRFTNKTFLKNAPAPAVVIGRLRGDARLHEAVEPSVSASPAGGRPRWYGPRLPTPEELRKDAQVPWQEVEAYAAGQRHLFKIKTLDKVRWRVTGAKRALRLIVIAPLAYRPRKGRRLLYRKPAYLICTDPSLPLARVLQAYLWRWGIEVNFRDQKTLLGVGQARVRNPYSIAHVPATAVAAYAMLLIAARQAQLSPSLPLPAWRRSRPAAHATCATLINQLRYELWSSALNPGLCDFSFSPPHELKSHKPQPHLESAVLYAIAG